MKLTDKLRELLSSLSQHPDPKVAQIVSEAIGMMSVDPAVQLPPPPPYSDPSEPEQDEQTEQEKQEPYATERKKLAGSEPQVAPEGMEGTWGEGYIERRFNKRV